MDIQHDKAEHSGEFFVEENSERIAELAYSMPQQDKLVINHTEVDEKLKGKGVGKQLVLAVIAYARVNQLRVVPVCSYAKTVIMRDESLQDVL